MQKSGLRALAKQIIKFVLVGGMNTGIHFLIFNILLWVTGIVAGLGAAIFTGIAFIIANTNSYFFNKNWTFHDNSEDKEVVKFGTFFLVSFIGFLINFTVVFLVTQYFDPFFGDAAIVAFVETIIDPGKAWANIALLIATSIALIWNFIGYKTLVFKQ